MGIDQRFARHIAERFCSRRVPCPPAYRETFAHPHTAGRRGGFSAQARRMTSRAGYPFGCFAMPNRSACGGVESKRQVPASRDRELRGSAQSGRWRIGAPQSGSQHPHDDGGLTPLLGIADPARGGQAPAIAFPYPSAPGRRRHTASRGWFPRREASGAAGDQRAAHEGARLTHVNIFFDPQSGVDLCSRKERLIARRISWFKATTTFSCDNEKTSPSTSKGNSGPR